MIALYLFGLGLGGVLLAASFFAEAEGPDDFSDASWQQLFSLRNLTYFLFVFGAVGSALTLAIEGKPGLSVLLFASGSGLAVAAGEGGGVASAASQRANAAYTILESLASRFGLNIDTVIQGALKPGAGTEAAGATGAPGRP